MQRWKVCSRKCGKKIKFMPNPKYRMLYHWRRISFANDKAPRFSILILDFPDMRRDCRDQDLFLKWAQEAPASSSGIFTSSVCQSIMQRWSISTKALWRLRRSVNLILIGPRTPCAHDEGNSGSMTSLSEWSISESCKVVEFTSIMTGIVCELLWKNETTFLIWIEKRDIAYKVISR